MALHKETFSTELDTELVAKVRAMADSEHRAVDAVVEEALLNLLQKRSGVRPEVMEHYRDSVAEFSEVYRHLSQ